MFKTPSVMGQFGPAIHLPIFNGFSGMATYRGAEGQYQESVAAYNQTLVLALKDVADAAVSIRTIHAQLADARQALTHNEEAWRIAKARYQGGLSPYLSVLVSENALISQKRLVADLEGLAFTYDIALVRALGGGYQSAASPAPTAR
jgi:outer membrane protein TolC